jgi:hypothetical protein
MSNETNPEEEKKIEMQTIEKAKEFLEQYVAMIAWWFNQPKVLEEPRPVCIRHDQSGVWIGYILGTADMIPGLRVRGRRVWRWQDGRLDTSQIAVRGAKPQDSLGDLVTEDLSAFGFVDVIDMDPDLVEACFALPPYDPKNNNQ